MELIKINKTKPKQFSVNRYFKSPYRFLQAFTLLMAIVLFQSCNPKEKAEDKDEASTSQDSSATAWSVKLAETLMRQYPELWMMEGRDEPRWSYTYGLVSYAFIVLSEKTGNEAYYKYALDYAQKLINPDGSINTYSIGEYNIDHITPGRPLFDIYAKEKDERYKIVIDTLRKQLVGHPRTKVGGFWHKQRYPHQMWLDGVYMGAPFYARYSKEYNEPENFDDIANWIIQVELKTRDDSTGLLYHAWDESKEQKWADPVTGHSPNFWGRAMGWYTMAVVDVLDYFPEDHPKRGELVNIVKRLAEAIQKVQDPESGVWYQVLDKPDSEGNFLEGSVSCMFVYALAKAVRLGYIDESYKEMVLKGYDGILKNLIKTEGENIIITPVCAVAGLGGDPYRDGSYEYYINEKQRDNDPKATGPFILAGPEIDQIK